MSTNLHLAGCRTLIVKETGEEILDRCNIDLYQTPSDVTERIMKSEDKLQAYFDWVKEDPFIHDSTSHIDEVNNAIKLAKTGGYSLRFSAW